MLEVEQAARCEQQYLTNLDRLVLTFKDALKTTAESHSATSVPVPHALEPALSLPRKPQDIHPFGIFGLLLPVLISLVIFIHFVSMASASTSSH